MSRPFVKPRSALALSTLLVVMMAMLLIMNMRFLPFLHRPQQQSSRITAWEDGMPTTKKSFSYAESLLKSHHRDQPPSPSTSIITTSTSSSTIDKPSFLKKTSGSGWKMWDQSSILFDNMNLTCNWNDYRPFIGRGEVAPPVPFCAHPLSDDQFVSNNIVKKGRHLECDSLPTLLAHSSLMVESSEKVGERADNNDPTSIYIDVGANIGTCVMQMLLTTDAMIMAFEPHPYNLFVMTSTFMKLDEKYRKRILLFPIALGAESSDSTIHMASDNRGHAVVSKVIRINNKATFLAPMPIRIEPLDSIIQESTVVHLMKMDAQGFECYIFDGMKKILQQSRLVFFELEKKVLNGFDRCSPQLLWDKFIQAGFEMHVGGPGRRATKEMPDRGKVNILASNTKRNTYSKQ